MYIGKGNWNSSVERFINVYNLTVKHDILSLNRRGIDFRENLVTVSKHCLVDCYLKWSFYLIKFAWFLGIVLWIF